MAKSEFVSTFDIAESIFKKLSNEVQNLGGGDEHLRRIESDGGLRRVLAQTIVGWGKPVGTSLQAQAGSRDSFIDKWRDFLDAESDSLYW